MAEELESTTFIDIEYDRLCSYLENAAFRDYYDKASEHILQRSFQIAVDFEKNLLICLYYLESMMKFIFKDKIAERDSLNGEIFEIISIIKNDAPLLFYEENKILIMNYVDINQINDPLNIEKIEFDRLFSESMTKVKLLIRKDINIRLNTFLSSLLSKLDINYEENKELYNRIKKFITQCWN